MDHLERAYMRKPSGATGSFKEQAADMERVAGELGCTVAEKHVPYQEGDMQKQFEQATGMNLGDTKLRDAIVPKHE